MIITSRKLQDSLGISSSIADYFANERPIPANNLFWQNKRIYISGGFGFLTIPLAFDLIHRAGVPLNILLSDEHVSLMENGFHELKRYESGEIPFKQFLDNCKQLWGPLVKQEKLADDIYRILSGKEAIFFKFETTHKALARSDAFLFTLVDLELTDEWVEQFLPYWYSLARPILLLDDFKDLVEDRRNNEENTIIELGNDANGIRAAYELGINDLEKLSTINPRLAKYLLAFLKESLQYNHIQAELG
jgi:hypothetical protein